MVPQEHRDPLLLAIDGSEEIHRLLKDRLRHARLEIHGATSGEKGLVMAQALLPDVILLDLELPDRDGFSVLRDLKANSRTHDIPVIFVSGSSATTSKVKGFDMGAIDFVTKPFEIAELKARVRSAVRLRLLINMLAQRARIDGLTGLWNRTFFDERLSEELADALRYNTALALIMADLDGFKAINDAHGHPFGDQVLEEFAKLLTRGRQGDIPCRYGGEEFCVILPHTSARAAVRVADRLRESLKARRWDGHDDQVVTASFGVADLEAATEQESNALIHAADQALYAAKQAGRDRVVVASKPSDPVVLSA